jgi:hypothetical protein
MSSKRRRPVGAPDLLSNLERLDEAMRSVYGRTFDQFGYETFQRGYECGYKQGVRDGYKEGIKGGRRLAKGKAEFPKNPFSKSGRPPMLDPVLLAPKFIEFVDDWMREDGLSLPAAVSKYREVFGRAWKGRREVPNQEQLLRLYHREKKKKSAPDSRPIK